MRVNGFGDTYCHSAAEVRSYVDEHSDGTVHASEIDPPEGDFKAAAEVRENESGDTVCWIEAPTVEEVRAILVAASIEIV